MIDLTDLIVRSNFHSLVAIAVEPDASDQALVRFALPIHLDCFGKTPALSAFRRRFDLVAGLVAPARRYDVRATGAQVREQPYGSRRLTPVARVGLNCCRH